MNDRRRLTAVFALIVAVLAGSPLFGAQVDVVELRVDR